MRWQKEGPCFLAGLGRRWSGVVEQVCSHSQASCEESSHWQCTCHTPWKMALLTVLDLLHTLGADQILVGNSGS